MARKTLYHLCCAVAVVGFFMRNLRPGILLQNLGLAGCFALVLIELAAAVRRKRFDSDEDAAAGTTNASQEFAGRPESKSRTNHFSWKVFWILYSLTIAVNAVAFFQGKNIGLVIGSIVIAGAFLLAALQCMYRGVVVGRSALLWRGETPVMFWVSVTLFLGVYLVMSFASWY